MMANSASVYFSYAREDKALILEGLITTWHDHAISPRKHWASEIDRYLSTAQIILLLVSPDYTETDYCYSVEMARALERHQSGEVRVIPIILRPVYREHTPFSMLETLPLGGKAITQWRDRDEAFFKVAEGIRRAVEELSSLKSLFYPCLQQSIDTHSLSEEPSLRVQRSEAASGSDGVQIRSVNATGDEAPDRSFSQTKNARDQKHGR
jgi:hypothetical protein